MPRPPSVKLLQRRYEQAVSRSLKADRAYKPGHHVRVEADNDLEKARTRLFVAMNRENSRPMNSSTGEVDDSSRVCGPGQTTTPSGAGPQEGRPQSGSSTTTGPEASGPPSRSAHTRT